MIQLIFQSSWKQDVIEAIHRAISELQARLNALVDTTIKIDPSFF
ncbi:MAG: hypothetical protein ACI4NN_06420 [Pyramidobacter sp.]|jgi:hypothetical protein